MEKIQVHIIVHGLVQGVYFRKFTKDNAEKLNLKGFVKNLSTGEVEIIAEGKKEKIYNFIEKIKSGPVNANVKNTKIKILDFKNEYNRFDIIQ